MPFSYAKTNDLRIGIISAMHNEVDLLLQETDIDHTDSMGVWISTLVFFAVSLL